MTRIPPSPFEAERAREMQAGLESRHIFSMRNGDDAFELHRLHDGMYAITATSASATAGTSLVVGRWTKSDLSKLQYALWREMENG